MSNSFFPPLHFGMRNNLSEVLYSFFRRVFWRHLGEIKGTTKPVPAGFTFTNDCIKSTMC